MKTEELITMLARDEPSTDLQSALNRYALALGWGAFAAVLLMAVFLGVRTDLAQAAARPMLWAKVAFAVVLVGAGLVASLRLSRPGVPLGRVGWIVLAALALIWGWAALDLAAAEPQDRTALLLGKTWKTCPWLIAGLALPSMIGLIWAMRGMAPTRPRLAGGAIGLLAGAVATMVYCLHCPESAAPFVAVWYVLGISLPALLGVVIGPRLLRW